MAKYQIEFFGDLKGRRSELYDSLDDALRDLAMEWKFLVQNPYEDKWGNHIGWDSPYIPDPEDDRVVVWEYGESEPKCVWHFSGWHWDPNASDLNGGPLEQGKLPAATTYHAERSLYELAMEDF